MLRKLLAVKKYAAIFIFLTFILFPGTAHGEVKQLSQKEFVEGFLKIVQMNTYWVENYRFQYWDCTNQSTVLYTTLTAFGIETKIVTGRFGNEYNWHAMLEVVLDKKEYRIEPIYLTFYEPGDLETRNWNEWSKYSLERAMLIWPWEFYYPKELSPILFTKEDN